MAAAEEQLLHIAVTYAFRGFETIDAPFESFVHTVPLGIVRVRPVPGPPPNPATPAELAGFLLGCNHATFRETPVDGFPSGIYAHASTGQQIKDPSDLQEDCHVLVYNRNLFLDEEAAAHAAEWHGRLPEEAGGIRHKIIEACGAGAEDLIDTVAEQFKATGFPDLPEEPGLPPVEQLRIVANPVAKRLREKAAEAVAAIAEGNAAAAYADDCIANRVRARALKDTETPQYHMIAAIVGADFGAVVQWARTAAERCAWPVRFVAAGFGVCPTATAKIPEGAVGLLKNIIAQINVLPELNDPVVLVLVEDVTVQYPREPVRLDWDTASLKHAEHTARQNGFIRPWIVYATDELRRLVGGDDQDLQLPITINGTTADIAANAFETVRSPTNELYQGEMLEKILAGIEHIKHTFKHK